MTAIYRSFSEADCLVETRCARVSRPRMLSVDEQKMQLIGWFPLVILLGLLAIQRPAVAQAQASRDVPGAAEIGHVTDVLNDTDEARRARASFHEARRLGLHVRHKTAIEYEIGARRSFFVHD